MEQNTTNTPAMPDPPIRRNTATDKERQQMQRGYPIRENADPTTQRMVNRATGPREVPERLRQGKVPVRRDASTGRTYPVMQRGDTDRRGAPQPHAAPRPQATSPRPEPVVRPTPDHDPLSDTQTFTRIPQNDIPQKKPSPLTKLLKMPQLGVGIACIVLVIGLAIGIPVALSHHTTTQPDFSMSTDYMPTESDTKPEVVETAGVGREEVTETETEAGVKFSVTLTFYEREPITVSTGEITLGELLKVVGYTVQDTDSFPLALDTLLTEETTVAVDTVTYDTATETVVLPYTSKITEVQTIPKGQKNLSQAGQNGSKTITYTIKLVNGTEVERTVASEDVTVQPVDEIAEVGVGGTLVGNDGVTYSYSYYRVVNATYYDIPGATYLGYDADESVVATDFDYIPAGTKIYVKNDRYDFGVRTAADTGSSIDGWEVDIWLGSSNPQKAAFAKEGYIHDMIIYYID